MRHEYETRGLDAADLAEDPMEQFQLWLADAVAAQVMEPNAMVLSTVDAAGVPSARHVLLKGITEGGFEFYTNYESGKGDDIAGNPNVALTFGWLGLHRQVCVVGRAAKLRPEESDTYFDVRPRGSQLGAWVSNQSTEISGREVLAERQSELAERFAGGPVPRPPYWGGYRVMPQEIEFWQGRPSRLHDRLRFRRVGPSTDPPVWQVARLAP